MAHNFMSYHCGAILSNHESKVVWKLWWQVQLTTHLLIWNLQVCALCISVYISECMCVWLSSRLHDLPWLIVIQYQELMIQLGVTTEYILCASSHKQNGII